MISLRPPFGPYPSILLPTILQSAEVIDYHRSLNTNFRDARHSAFCKNSYPLRHSEGVVMNNENKDVITLIELLKMAAERRRRSTDQISEDEPFSEDLS